MAQSPSWKKNRLGKYKACIDETDAYKGAVEMLDEAMLAAHSEGII